VILVVCLCHGIDHVIVAVIASLIGALAGAKVEWIRDFLNR
jgi:bacterioferritin-associated ferredoxin